MEKHLAVINGDRVLEIVVRPGTTAEDMRRQLDLPQSLMLSRRDGLPFGATEEVFGQVRDGEKLYASPPAVVGLGEGLNSVLGLLKRLSAPASTSGRASGRVVAPAGARAPSGRRPVKRNTQPFHEERGWKPRGSAIRGYYRTKHGSFAGRIERPLSRDAEYFIIDPPKRLLDGPHGACFRQRGPREFFVHWNRPPETVDVGILRIEHALLEVFR